MESSHCPASDFVPLSRESLELYAQFWAQMGVATTTEPPMDFLALKAGALEWAERLKLPAGILVKFRQRIGAAQSDREVFGVMEDFRRLATAPAEAAAAGGAPRAGRDAAMKRKGRRSMTLAMSARAIGLVDQGLSNRAIASELGVSLAAVKRNLAVGRARAQLKGRRAEMQPGHKSKLGDVEAYGDLNEDGERKPFRPH